MLQTLSRQQKHIIFQWIPSHIDLMENETADLLAKRVQECHANQAYLEHSIQPFINLFKALLIIKLMIISVIEHPIEGQGRLNQLLASHHLSEEEMKDLSASIGVTGSPIVTEYQD